MPEPDRLLFIREREVIDSPRNQKFDFITKMVTSIFGAFGSTISIVDHTRIWFKSEFGLGANEIPLELGLCGSAYKYDEFYYIEDALNHEIAKCNSLVTHAPYLRFYAAIPIKIRGYHVGTLSLLDTKPRILNSRDVELFEQFGNMVNVLFEEEINSKENIHSLENRLQTFRKFLDSTNEIITYVDRNLKLQYINQAGKNITNYFFKRSPDLGDNCFDYILPENKAEFKRYFNLVMDGIPQHFEKYLDGVCYNFEMSPVYEKDQVMGVVFYVRDISDKMFKTTQLININQLLKEIVWKQSHVVRKPLANILGLISILDSSKDEKVQKQIKERIMSSADEQDTIIHQVIKESEGLLGENDAMLPDS